MLNTPEIVERASQPYAAIAAVVRMDELSAAIDKALPAVFGWLAARGAAPAGAPFFRYRVIDMPNRLEIDFGVPTASVLEADDAITTGELPAGRYVSATHTGHYDGLMAATAELLKWIDDQHLALDQRKTNLGDAFGCRLELYHTDPRTEPDPSRFKTELAMRLADQGVASG
jgi:effector-binding domain-containing protein